MHRTKILCQNFGLRLSNKSFDFAVFKGILEGIRMPIFILWEKGRIQNFDVKVEWTVWLDSPGFESASTVGVVRGSLDESLFSDRHCHHTFIPCFDDGSLANLEGKGFLSRITRAISHFATELIS